MSAKTRNTAFGFLIAESSTELEMNSGVISVKKSLIVTLNITTVVVAQSCTVSNPGFICGQIFVTPPNEPEREIIRITSGEVSPGGSCLGTHTQTKSATPLGGSTGIYTIRFHGENAFLFSPGSTLTGTPSVFIIADGNLVVKSPYPAVTGEGQVNDSWQFSFEP